MRQLPGRLRMQKKSEKLRSKTGKGWACRAEDKRRPNPNIRDRTETDDFARESSPHVTGLNQLPATCWRVIRAASSPLERCSASSGFTRANRSILRAIVPVQPV